MTAHLLYYWVFLSFDAEDIVFLNKKYIHLLKKTYLHSELHKEVHGLKPHAN